MFTVYILYSPSLDTFYKGQTDDIQDRLRRHNAGYEAATKAGAPWELVWSTQKDTRSDAVILEKKLKNLSRVRTMQFIKKYS